jgi:hypothetical protein
MNLPINYTNWNFSTIELDKITNNEMGKLLKLEYNPSPMIHQSLIVYNRNYLPYLKQQFGESIYKELIQDNWFKLTGEPFFEINFGSRLTKNDPIGTGGFGTVFKQVINNKKMAVKCVNITEHFKKVKLDINNSNKVMSDLIKEVLGSTLHESTIQNKLNYANILKSEESWIQFRDLKTI